MSLVEGQVLGEIAVIAINAPPANALSVPVRVGLAQALEQAQHDEQVRAIVLMGKGRMFVAGADISEFGTERARTEPLISTLQRMIAGSAKPVVAAIHGVALGGGLELALACHARVATGDAQIGLPEVTLGTIPGAGGTQWLPRLAGPDLAIDLITSGRRISAERACELGVIDEIVDLLEDGAVDFARRALADGRKFVPIVEFDEKIRGVDPELFEHWRKRLASKMRGRLAPQAAVDCVEAACTLPAAEGLAYEKNRATEMKATDQFRALQRYFFCEREAAKIFPKGDAPVTEHVGSVAVIGSGTMGGGIAMAFAGNGFPVRLLDTDAEALDRGMDRIRSNFAISVKRGSLTQATVDEALARIEPTTDYQSISQADLVVEAVFEDMETKKAVFAKLDTIAAPHAILGTNTSTLSIDEIASVTTRPERVVGLHFFAPANVMKLLEVIRGTATSREVIATAMALGKRIGKVAVLARNCDGFIGNRMLQYYSGEAEFLLEQGATPERIDRIAVAFGLPMGPFALRDMTGIDVNVLVRRARRKTLAREERMSMIPDLLFEAGRLGQKSGLGYYRYEGSREPVSDPVALDIIRKAAREAGVAQREFTDEEIADRLFMPLVNEGIKELEDGTAMRAGDIDVVWINGYAFPKHKGGPMFWGENEGLGRVRDLALELQALNGPRWGPSALLDRLVSTGEPLDSVRVSA